MHGGNGHQKGQGGHDRLLRPDPDYPIHLGVEPEPLEDRLGKRLYLVEAA